MIGVLGGYGAVGAQAARLLGAMGAGPLRLGGRNPETARRRGGAGLPPADLVAVDIEDEASLAAFVRDCRVVVNCAGPSHRTAEQVARAARSVGTHHVDAGSAAGLERLSGTEADTAIVFSAGALPGLSGVLPRWLASGFDAVHRVTFYAGVLDRFTAVGAEDYLAGILDGDSESLAAWRDGRRRSAALTRRTGVTLPFFPRDVSVLPFFDAESEGVARDLRLSEGDWHIILDGEHLSAALDGARTMERAAAVERLCRASALDVAGRRPYAAFLVQLDGLVGGRKAVRTLLLQASGISVLTGAMVAAVTIALLQGKVPPGVRPAATIHRPQSVMSALLAMPDICRMTTFDAAIEDLEHASEGAI